MRKMIGVVLGVAIAASVSAGQAFAFLDYYQEPQAPQAGDCNAIAARIGPDATWYGEFAGNRYDEFNERRYPFSDRGCFPNEFECRAWQNQAVSYAGRGGIVYMRCRPGLPG